MCAGREHGPPLGVGGGGGGGTEISEEERDWRGAVMRGTSTLDEMVMHLNRPGLGVHAKEFKKGVSKEVRQKPNAVVDDAPRFCT